MRSWHEDSNFVVVLSAVDEHELLSYWHKMTDVTAAVLVREPDIDDEATAFAVLGPAAGRMLSALPLCLKVPAMT